VEVAKRPTGKLIVFMRTLNGQRVNAPETADFAPKDLPNIVGKDLAEKITADLKKIQPIDKEGVTDDKLLKYEGQDLKVGGEWAVNLYDKQLPSFLDDYVKKFGSEVTAIKIAPYRTLSENLYIEEGEPDVEGNRLYYVYDKTNKTEPLGDFEDAEIRSSLHRRIRRASGQGSRAVSPAGHPYHPELKQAVLYEGQPVFGKMPAEIGRPGPSKTWKFIFRMTDSVEVINTKGEKVTPPKRRGISYLRRPRQRRQHRPRQGKTAGRQTDHRLRGELGKLKGHLLPSGEGPMAGGLPAAAGGEPPKIPPRPCRGRPRRGAAKAMTNYVQPGNWKWTEKPKSAKTNYKTF